MWILSSKEVVSLYTSADGKALFGFCNCLYYSSNNNSFNLKVSILYQGQSWRVQAITHPHTSRPVPCFPSLCVPHASPESTHLLSPALWPWVAGLLNEKSIKPQVKILRFFFFFFLLWPLSHLGQVPSHTLLLQLFEVPVFPSANPFALFLW